MNINNADAVVVTRKNQHDNNGGEVYHCFLSGNDTLSKLSNDSACISNSVSRSTGTCSSLVPTTYRQNKDVIFEKCAKKKPYSDFKQALEAAILQYEVNTNNYAWTKMKRMDFVKDFLRDYAKEKCIRFFLRHQEKGFPILCNHLEEDFVKTVCNKLKAVLPKTAKNRTMMTEVVMTFEQGVTHGESTNQVELNECSFVEAVDVDNDESDNDESDIDNFSLSLSCVDTIDDQEIYIDQEHELNPRAEFQPSCTCTEVAEKLMSKHVYALDENNRVLNDGIPLNVPREGGTMPRLSNFPTAKVLLSEREEIDVIIKNGKQGGRFTQVGRFTQACETKLQEYNSCGSEKSDFVKNLLTDYAHDNNVRFFIYFKGQSYPILYGHSDSSNDKEIVKSIVQKFSDLRKKKQDEKEKIDPKEKVNRGSNKRKAVNNSGLVHSKKCTSGKTAPVAAAAVAVHTRGVIAEKPVAQQSAFPEQCDPVHGENSKFLNKVSL
eukprot:CAMPEP_0203662260 /NCGR_PEP_ID=MMETSP0090-20130426/285_1 /ASSEMBLY_ACC=CAM_ASM_001088 /TAXON_ID=426623 /ORGANISM="Chaetoceros affinis, Strain CCMP159" /LENGTH=490 /DNA_ID=CAMNT_0050525021 /DNA_START=92 /DNA_END=1564 /DNA_ORIENTATION=-